MRAIIMILLVLMMGVVKGQDNLPGIPYQAVVRNFDGTPMTNMSIDMRFSIRNGDALNGAIVYQENHVVTTSSMGLMSAVIGEGEVLNGDFSQIDWSVMPKFLQVEFKGPNNADYIEMGNQQLMSVPYAMYSKNINLNVSSVGDTLTIGNNSVIVPGISLANQVPIVMGCMNNQACNFNINANQNDNNCFFIGDNCNDGNNSTMNDSISINCDCVGEINSLEMFIGQEFGGGKIAYIFQPSDNGFVDGEVHGIIAAAQDLPGTYIWGCSDTLIQGADDRSIGMGMQNTIDMINSNCGDAAQVCSNLLLNGFDDWFLPSQDELQQLYLNRTAIGGFVNWVYWSSNERDIGQAWNFYFLNGGYNFGGKYGNYIVRPVRYF